MGCKCSNTVVLHTRIGIIDTNSVETSTVVDAKLSTGMLAEPEKNKEEIREIVDDILKDLFRRFERTISRNPFYQ